MENLPAHFADSQASLLLSIGKAAEGVAGEVQLLRFQILFKHGEKAFKVYFNTLQMVYCHLNILTSFPFELTFHLAA